MFLKLLVSVRDTLKARQVPSEFLEFHVSVTGFLKALQACAEFLKFPPLSPAPQSPALSCRVHCDPVVVPDFFGTSVILDNIQALEHLLQLQRAPC